MGSLPIRVAVAGPRTIIATTAQITQTKGSIHQERAKMVAKEERRKEKAKVSGAKAKESEA